MNTIVTNERFDRLTNLDISTHHKDKEYYFFPSDFLSALAYWIVAQNPNKQLIGLHYINPALLAFEDYIIPKFKNVKMPEKFTYDELSEIVNDDVFENLPAIMALNTMKPDFIDLGALARNVFYMMLREQITQQ